MTTFYYSVFASPDLTLENRIYAGLLSKDLVRFSKSENIVSNLENVKNLIEINTGVFIINNSRQLYVRNDIAKPYLERIEREKPERIERLNKINSIQCSKNF